VLGEDVGTRGGVPAFVFKIVNAQTGGLFVRVYRGLAEKPILPPRRSGEVVL
jgi:hypothetical protein